ncbi:MAG: SDR family NAD(P)-dependent oxidoreductase [Candidatus Nitrosocaldus sp.]|nr:SDR family NAD(P)-dependent oxidoreductase [Candidatus Nitrosocaldus sp.]MDW8275065.1 SDR family NAD(P)-dependent oxidoreductase [Candidatus Nitrosocaldus sp.]
MNYISNSLVLVTGAMGFLGSHLCKRLSAMNCDVVGVDNLSFSKLSVDKHNNVMNKILFKELDITRADHVETLFRDHKFDIVFHLAAVANPRICKENFDLAFNVNVMGTKNILSNSKNCDKIVFISSAAVYGEPLTIPIAEDHPLNGTDPYAITKIIGEKLCLNFVKNYGYRVVIVRNFNTFGIGQSGDYIIPTLIRQALVHKVIEIWNSKPIRDMMYVDDTIDALLTITSTNNTDFDVYNIGSGRGIQIGKLADIIKQNIGNGINVIDLQKPVLGSPKLIADNTKLKSLGWKESVGFEEGIRRTIEWFRTLI